MQRVRAARFTPQHINTATGCPQHLLPKDEEDAVGADAAAASATSSPWHTAPADVLLALLPYLKPADAAAARLACRAWRASLAAAATELRLPLAFLSDRATALRALGRAAAALPELAAARLHAAAGWCDPVQARACLEPLVATESRLVALDALAGALPALRALRLEDAAFARRPWDLGAELVKLPDLSDLSVAWAAAPWPPAQGLQEWAGLRVSVTWPTACCVVCAACCALRAGDAAVAGLRLLGWGGCGIAQPQQLPPATSTTHPIGQTITALQTAYTQQSKQGVFSLTRLTRLELRKGARAPLGEPPLAGAALAAAGVLTALRRLELATVHIANAGAAARGGGDDMSGSGGGAGALEALGLLTGLTRLSLRGQVASPLKPLRALFTRLSRLEELELGALPAANEDLAAVVEAHQRRQRQQQQHRQGRRPPRGPPLRRQQPADSVDDGSGKEDEEEGWLRDDWSAVFAPLRRLRRLRLHSDLALLGGCGALRTGLPRLGHLELHGGAKFLEVGGAASGGALPASWLRPEVAPAVPSADGQASSSAEWAAGAGGGGGGDDSGSAALASGWPALRRLQIDGLQLADGLTAAAARLGALRTLVASGPCLLAHQPLHRMLAPALVAQMRAQLAVASGGGGGDDGAGGGVAAAGGGGEALVAAAAAQLGPARVALRGGRPADGVEEGDDDDGGGLLARLAPLKELERFELHLQAAASPAALRLTDALLAPLLAAWRGLTSLHFDVWAPPAPWLAPLSRPAAALPPLAALAFGTSLRDLGLHFFDSDGDLSSNGGWAAAAAAAAADAGVAPQHHHACSASGGSGSGAIAAAAARPPAPVDWARLPPYLESLSLSSFQQIEPSDLAEMAAACPGLRHLRLLHCGATDAHLAAAARAWPRLETLVVKEAPGGGAAGGAGAGSAGLAAIAVRLPRLRPLAVTVLPGADAAPLAALTRLERLLLDGRASDTVAGWPALAALTRLRILALPLLQMQRPGAAAAAFASLCTALRGAVIANVTSMLSEQRGCQWFGQFDERERDWWRPPAAPWEWMPYLSIRP